MVALNISFRICGFCARSDYSSPHPSWFWCEIVNVFLSRLFSFPFSPQKRHETRLEEIHFCLIIKNYINNCGWSHKSSTTKTRASLLKAHSACQSPKHLAATLIDCRTRSDCYKTIYKTLLSSSRASYLLETRLVSRARSSSPRRMSKSEWEFK
jgi:hypothetical protein